MKRIFTVLLLVFLLCSSSCKSKKNVATDYPDDFDKEKIYAQIELTDGRLINLELYPDIAPITVNRFVTLANENFYDNLIFHRVIKNFMIQTGGFYIDGKTIYPKDTDYQPIKGEFSTNGWDKNDLKHTAGVISMARATDNDTATAQFFICSTTYPSLDGMYAAFGKVTDEESLQVVLDISFVNTCQIPGSYLTDFPVEPITIKTVRTANTMYLRGEHE